MGKIISTRESVAMKATETHPFIRANKTFECHPNVAEKLVKNKWATRKTKADK